MTENCEASNAKDLRSAIIAACAMLLTFAAVAVPVPLYAEYKIALGLTDADISLTMVSYLTGVLTTLFVGGSLSVASRLWPLPCYSARLPARFTSGCLTGPPCKSPVWCKAYRAVLP